MKILLCTGIYPPDIGGPAQYAQKLAGEFLRTGHEVKVLAYGAEKKLPILVRHCLFFFRTVFNIRRADFLLALDTFSVGWPAVCAARLFGKKIIIRIGGDFLWEGYVEQTGHLVTLPDFYRKKPPLPFKYKVIYRLQNFVLKKASALVFSTEWQRNIWQHEYGVNPRRVFVIENFYGEKLNSNEPQEKNFVFFGRLLKLKNLQMLKEAFSEAQKTNPEIKLEIYTDASREFLLARLKNCYAAIQPSVSDVSPNFILEAIQFNKPFILTKETGLYEKLKNIGLFVNPLDREDIKGKILFLADNENYYDYKRKVENFTFSHSWQEIAEEFLMIYKNL